MSGTGISKLIEQQNQNRIISFIEKGSISRAEIAKQTGLSRTTVSNVCSRLMELELVQEGNQADGAIGRGRPGTPLFLTKDRWFAAGATLIDKEVIFVLLRLSGEIAYTFSLPVRDLSHGAFLDTMTRGFAKILEKCPGDLLPCLGVGSPGIINEGVILCASDMGWEQVDIAGHLKRELGMESDTINRHWASCMCEYHHQSVSTMIYVGISTGIAAAIIADGELFTGASHSAGEIGHTVVYPGGPACVCGRRGCLHAVSSETFIVHHVNDRYQRTNGALYEGDPLWAKMELGKKLDIEDVCRAADVGHPLAKEMLERGALYLGLSISNLIGMFNPECVVLGGSMMEHGGASFSQGIISSIHQFSSADTLKAVKILPWTQGRVSGAVGAARLVLDRKIELAEKFIAKKAYKH